jgi:hypothetical protein
MVQTVAWNVFTVNYDRSVRQILFKVIIIIIIVFVKFLF